MTAQKPLDPSDLNALAAEVMDIWQDHLAVYAADPKAKAELMHLLEPQRQLFADWAVMMQNSLHGAGANSTSSNSASGAANPSGAANQGPVNSGKSSAGTSGAASAAAPYDDGALRLAQLAHRVAELEKTARSMGSKSSGIPSCTKNCSGHFKIIPRKIKVTTPIFRAR